VVCMEKFVYWLMLASLSYKLKYSGTPKLPIKFYWKVFASNFKRTYIKAFLDTWRSICGSVCGIM